jgi:hypothetical protein
MRGCEILWSDVAVADAVQARMEEAIGGPCPCKVGKRCPLLPADVGAILVDRPAVAEAV